jgi:hypothetical protein
VESLSFDAFRRLFEKKVGEYGITWEAVGFYAPDGKVYPFGTDTKVISTVFEALAAPLIREIADAWGYTIEGSEQTVYPDFTLTPPSHQPPRIAIDIKTTYRRRGVGDCLHPFRFTLGSYTSFLRTPGAKKNIKYPYVQYGDHWIIGFLYTRRAGVGAKVYYRLEDVSELLCPYTAVEYYVQEKYRIVGLTPASGNTTNIGSFPTNRIEDLREGIGPFSQHGKAVCDEYWRHFPSRKSDRAYSTVEQFLAWKKRQS